MVGKQPKEIDRRDILKTMGLLGATATTTSSATGSKYLARENNLYNKTNTSVDLSSANKPVWMTHESDVGEDWVSGGDVYLSNKLTLQYFGASWDPNPDARDTASWKHKFMLTGSGYVFVDANESKDPDNPDYHMTNGVGEQRFGVTSGDGGDILTISPHHGTGSIGFIGPQDVNAIVEEEAGDILAPELAEDLYNAMDNPDSLNFEERFTELNEEYTHQTGEPLAWGPVGSALAVGIGYGVRALWGSNPYTLVTAFAVKAGWELLSGYLEEPDDEPINLKNGFEHPLDSSDPGVGGVHFASFDVLVSPGEGSTIDILSQFDSANINTELNPTYEIEPLPEPDPGISCVDDSYMWKEGANPATLPENGGNSEWLLESPGYPAPTIVEPTDGDNNIPLNATVPISSEKDSSMDIIDHYWFVDDSTGCKDVDYNNTDMEYKFTNTGVATIVNYQRNGAGLADVVSQDVYIDYAPVLPTGGATDFAIDFTNPTEDPGKDGFELPIGEDEWVVA